MHNKTLIAVALSLALGACAQQSPSGPVDQPQASASQQANSAKQLHDIVEGYFEANLALSPIFATFMGDHSANDKFGDPISAESLARERAIQETYLAKINALDPSELTGQDLLSYQIFKRDRELDLKGYRFPRQLMPINQMSGMHNYFASLGSGKSAQPFATVKDYDNFIGRSQGFVAWMDSAIVAMREGLARDIVLPRAIAEKLLPQMKAHMVEKVEDSVYWMPVANLPESIQGDDKAHVEQSYRKLIKEQLVPAYQRMYDFLENEYLPKARASVGYSALPDGLAWYEHQIKTNTTLDLGAEEIHELGLAEVRRIRNEMIKVKEEVKFEGDLAAFFKHLEESDEFYFDNEQEVIDGYLAMKERIGKRIPLLFDIQPKSEYEVRPVEKFRAASAAGASYQRPAPDGSRPGIFYINTHNLKAQPKFIMETLSIHEAAPGHHFQISLQQEIGDLPRFRRFGGYTVYSEGWALYAESLGKEMGLFTDPYQWYGRLADEQLRAMRLVVDTGLHAKGWTRQQAIDFMSENSSMAQSDIVAEVERYIAWPGQALSYKLGQRKIRELRDYAEQQLKEDFDVKKFHTQILIDGPLPMPILESKIKRWVASQQA